MPRTGRPPTGHPATTTGPGSGGLGGLPTTIWGVMSPMDEMYWETPPKT